MTFKEAVEQTADVKTGYKAGLSALGTDSVKIRASDTRLLNGSVHIDAHTAKIYAKDNRWDYAFSYKEEVYFVEVHPADTRDVDTVLKKLRWLKDWLNQHAPKINRLKKAQPAYYWIQTGGCAILKGSSQYRRIAQSGLKPIPLLKL